MSRSLSCFLSSCFFVLAVAGVVSAQDASFRDEGLHVGKPSLTAIRGATIHVSGSKVIENGTVLIRREKIIAVGTDVAIPDGTVIVDGTGKHVYAGLIDSYAAYSGTLTPSSGGTPYWNPKATPQISVADQLDLKQLGAEEHRKAGFTSMLVAPRDGVVRGSSSLVHLIDTNTARAIAKRQVAMNCRLTTNPSFGEGSSYPGSPMGAVAFARQLMLDAQWYREAWRVARANPQIDRPESNVALDAMQPVIAGEIPLMVETSNELFCLRAQRFAQEFGLRLVLLGSGNEYRRLDEVVATKAPIVVPLDFPQPPKVGSPTDALDVSLQSLMHWDIAPDNPTRLIGAGAKVAFTTNGLKKPGEWRGQLQKSIQRGLDPAAALDAWTTVPAKLFGVDDQLGSIEEGKLASLIVTDKPLFESKSKIVETFVLGERFEHEPAGPRQFSGIWQLKSSTDPLLSLFVVVNELPSAEASIRKALESSQENPDVEFKSVTLRDTKIAGTFEGKQFGHDGMTLMELIIDQPTEGIGKIVFADGSEVSVTAARIGDAPKSTKKRAGRDEDKDAEPKTDSADTPKDEVPDSKSSADSKDGDENKEDSESKPASYPVNYPLGDFGRDGAADQPISVLIKNVTVWTCGPAGNFENASVLFGNGTIERIIEAGQPLPAADVVIDGTGHHLTPGIIDCHSHMASDGGINEATQAVTAEVRVGDFVDCDDITIIRQLAGGVTSSNILHGSANPIGGQNQVIKLRWGMGDEQMKFTEAPQGIKFALGENVKQSNRPTPTNRYPRSRMGVEQIIRDAFRAGEEYQAKHDAWKTNRAGLPPRVDLEMEAIAEILRHERLIHCHSYRQDEILALLRLLDEHGIQIGTLQHILEGYKVAEALVEHGAMASAFADWWAYKVEVYDGIPHAGAMMHNMGICVSFNSDNAELARHLNHEAAKAVRYGGVSEIEALKFVTLNPARQLRIDTWVGSIEPGKHADLALWSGHPLALSSRCEQTWVDGRKYFDRAEEAARYTTQAEMRRTLIQKILASGQKMTEAGEEKIDPALLWPRHDEYCGHHHDDDDEGHGIEEHGIQQNHNDEINKN